ncbi:MAG: sodium:solute symporter family transporter [Cytophagaceae bacterium]
MQNGFGSIDYIILAVYFIMVFAVGLMYSKSQKGTVQHFLAGRNVGWFIIGSSLFTISSEHVIGYAEAGYNEGFAAGIFGWVGALALLLLGWFFIPFYIKSQVLTTPEFIEKRFGKKSGTFVAVFFILIYVITKVAVTLFSGAIFLELLLGWDKYTSSLALVLLTGVFAVSSGFKGILYTRVFHTYILILCAIVVTGVAVYNIGGLDELSKIPKEHFKIFKPSDSINYPWTGILFGGPILAIWYWCADQYIVQRVLSARDIENSRRGAVFGAYLMLLPTIILLVPGLVAYLKFGPTAIEGRAYFSLVSEVLPTGIKALAIVTLLSALISSLAACFNSTSTIFALDIYKKIYPQANEFRIVAVSKLANLVIVIISIVCISFMSYFSKDVFKHLQEVQSYISPPITAIFLVGILWARATGTAAFITLVVGGVLGISRLGLDIFRDSIATDSLLYDLLQVNFLHEAIFLFLFYILLMVGISLITAKPDALQLKGVTYKHRHEVDYADTMPAQQSLRWKRQDVISSVLLGLILLSLWIFLML